MVSRRFVTMGLVGILGLSLWVAESSATNSIESKIGNRTVRMTLTGTAVRTKRIFRVYTVNSYMEEGLPIKTAEDLANADSAKQLNLIMLRNVDGPEMAEAFMGAIRANYAAPMFDVELQRLTGIMRSKTARKGDQIWLTHVPGQGFQYQVVGEESHVIPNVEFSKAVWNIYFGRNNLGDHIKRGLSAKLGS